MRPQDTVKLVYQNEFGGEHLIADEKESLDRLIAECNSVSNRVVRSAAQDIGNDKARLFLASDAAKRLSPRCINKIFTASMVQQGSAISFAKKLKILREEARSGIFGFEENELDCFLHEYHAKGRYAVSHSQAYREAYAPAYRVIDSRFVRLLPLIIRINEQQEKKASLIVAIDGKAASGKTTAARLLGKLYDANIIHADDFFLPDELRAKERLGEIGGNFHVERFAEEVIMPLVRGTPFSYRPFDCRTNGFQQTVFVEPKPLTIVEGAYCMHKDLPGIYDIKVFFDIKAAEQKKRIKKRNSPGAAQRFIDLWIPMENRYIKGWNIKKRCDMQL
jgi:uridine kinase